MPVLIAVSYPDESTAARAAELAQALPDGPVIEPDAVAVVRRNRLGAFQSVTNHHEVAGATSWGMFWPLLFGLLLYVPVHGMTVGPGLGALLVQVEQTGITPRFRAGVRDALQPGTSAVFVLTGSASERTVRMQLAPLGGTVLSSAMSTADEAALQRELHGVRAAFPG
ncbi:MAG: DUF1269 domain-containing protein [Motilibacteraceae bacterium]